MDCLFPVCASWNFIGCGEDIASIRSSEGRLGGLVSMQKRVRNMIVRASIGDGQPMRGGMHISHITVSTEIRGSRRGSAGLSKASRMHVASHLPSAGKSGDGQAARGSANSTAL